LNRSTRPAPNPCSWVPASGWPPAKRGPSPNASARATIGADVGLEAAEQVEVGGGGSRQHQQLDRARHVGRAGRRVVDRPLPHRGNPLGELGRPPEQGRDPGPLRLQRERAADRPEADYAEGVKTHGMETSPTTIA